MGTSAALLVIRKHNHTWYIVHFNEQWKTRSALSGWYELLVVDDDKLEFWWHGNAHVEMTLDEEHGVALEDLKKLGEAPREFQEKMEAVRELARI